MTPSTSAFSIPRSNRCGSGRTTNGFVSPFVQWVDRDLIEAAIGVDLLSGPGGERLNRIRLYSGIPAEGFDTLAQSTLSVMEATDDNVVALRRH